MRAAQLSSIDTVFGGAPFAAPRPEKQAALVEELAALTSYHISASTGYARIVNSIFGLDSAASCTDLESLPWLPVALFKRTDLKSVPDDQIIRTLVSSGTTGQAVSRIYLDRETAAIQTKALAKIASEFIGKRRLPMVIIDDDSFLRDRTKFNARAAAILGFSNLGRDHLYALDAELRPDWDKLADYLSRQTDRPVFLFGFTFIVWQQFLQRARADGVRLEFPDGSILVHGGGWKRLLDQQVENSEFKAALAETFGIRRVHNYYGMVEQVGSIFFECEHGWLHTPSYADLLIRSASTLEPIPFGEQGLIQVFSVLPRSYPGHSLLTEDLGIIHGEDDCGCGRMGKRFSVSGRLPKAEIRGCSDTRVTPS